DVSRDPRGRVIAVGYFALLPYKSVDLTKAPDALHAQWVSINNLPELAFDHKKIIDVAVKRIKSKLNYSNLATTLLPDKFRLFDLQKVYEIVLGKTLDKRNFRKRIESLGLIESTDEVYRNGSHRPAKLYKFKTKQ